MKTGFIIINYNDAKTTQTLIENIKDYKVLDEIVIVDNASTDDSYQVLQKLVNSKITILKSSANKGYGAGINLAAKYLIQKYSKCNLIISNADIIIKTEQDIKELLKLFKKDVAVVAPTIIEHNQKNRGWHLSTPWQEIGQSIPFLYSRIEKRYRYYQAEHYQKETSLVDVVSGCFFLINGQVLKEIGYFDENVFLYYEENILASKLKKVKKKTVIANHIEVIHNHSVSIDKSLRKYKKTKALKKSQEYFTKEYLDASFLQRAILFLINRFSLGIKFILQK